MPRIIEVVPYNPKWPELFEQEAAALQAAFGENLVAVHHIGSTSIPDLAAKPILDILPVVKNIHKIDDDQLINLGYTPRGEMGMLFRRFYNKGEPRTHHLHVWEEGNPEIEKHLRFKNFLINKAEYRDKYAALKQDLAQQFREDRKNYTESKDDLIAEIIKKSGFVGNTIVQVNLPKEKQAYQQIMRSPTPIVTDNDLYFVMRQGVEIVCAAHVQIKPQLQIIALNKADAAEEEVREYMRLQLQRWLDGR